MSESATEPKYRKILTTIANGPGGQLDESIRQRLRILAEKETFKSDELLAIMDDSVYGALCTDMALSFMHAVWLLILDDENLLPRDALNQRDLSLRQCKIQPPSQSHGK